MPKPLPWAVTTLDEFVSCPWKYHEKRIAKSVVEPPGEAQLWGTDVHQKFELRQANGVALPLDLQSHEDFMKKLDAKPGVLFTEQKIALDKRAQPINNFFDRDVWYRGVIDWKKVDVETKTACLVDYKTGKPNEKWKQLMMFAIHTFAQHPGVEIVNAQYYWTATHRVTKKVWGRADVPELWGNFVADLRQFVEAFKSDQWQKRPSPLCGWCPVTSCEHWKSRR